MADSAARVCSTEGCGKPASLACPTCIKLNIPPSYFCAQDCFQRYWSVHKQLHALVKQTRVDPTTMPPEFTGYRFTGELRPHQRSPRREVPAHIRRPDYAVDGVPRSEIADRRSNTNIRVYTAEEIEGIRAACRIGREVLEEAARAVRVGITCDELDRIVHEATIARGAYPSPLNYNNFPKSVCTSVNEVICHGIPDMYELKDGDIVNLDVSVYYNGYHADLNETFMVGNVDEDSRRLVQTAYECLAAAVALVRPGTLYRELGQAISRVAHANGCSVVRTYCGHGIGELFHTAPNIPHYAKNKAKGVMKPGHVFTIEPMINLGGWQDVHWPDGWTAVTADGRRSAQFEHTMLVTEEGVELLTARPGETTMQWDPERFSR